MMRGRIVRQCGRSQTVYNISIVSQQPISWLVFIPSDYDITLDDAKLQCDADAQRNEQTILVLGV